MKISPVGSVDSSTARSATMEIWRMSMTQRMRHDMQQKVSGPEHKKEPRKVEPAVRVEISQQAREVAKKQQH